MIESSRRVAVVLHEPELGGASISLLRVIPRLEERGWQFSFWVPGRGAARDELIRRGYQVGSAPRLLRFSLRSLRQPPGPVRRLAALPAYLRSFRGWLAAQDAALVHANTLLALPELTALPRGAPPVVLHTHEVLPGGLKGRLAGRLSRRADVVVAVSGAVAEALSSSGVRASVVYPGVELTEPVVRNSSDGRVVVGTLGTVSRRKGSDVFVATAQRLRESLGVAEFRMAGDLVVGGERPWAQGVLGRALDQGIVHRAQVEPYAELAEWDVFVLPSRMDPCPMAVLEAMASGLPVVASRVGGIPEELGDDGGVLVESEDVAGFADAVLRLARAPELRASLGAAARRRVESEFTLARQADGLERAYRAALAARRPSG